MLHAVVGHGPGAALGLSWVPKQMGLPLPEQAAGPKGPGTSLQCCAGGRDPRARSPGRVHQRLEARWLCSSPCALSGCGEAIWKTSQPNRLAMATSFRKREGCGGVSGFPLFSPIRALSCHRSLRVQSAWAWRRRRRGTGRLRLGVVRALAPQSTELLLPLPGRGYRPARPRHRHGPGTAPPSGSRAVVFALLWQCRKKVVSHFPSSRWLPCSCLVFVLCSQRDYL